MPPALPDRYHLEVRQGRDGDIEEWLATDIALDRPVLVRILDADSTELRQNAFLAAARGAASVTHNHLTAIYSVGTLEGAAYCVSEWAGGMTLSDRIRANEPIPPEEFVPNAAGLSEALSALHAVGHMHGAIDGDAIFFSASHPAKIARFGREITSEEPTPAGDVAALANALEGALTHGQPGTVAPSQVVDRLPSAVDGALHEARTGSFDAGALASALHTVPSAPLVRQKSEWSWKWLGPVVALGIVALALVGFGASLIGGATTDPLALPTTTVATGIVSIDPTTTTVDTAEPAEDGVILLRNAVAYDPFGTGGEHDELAAASIDGDFTTAWKTESYLDPLPLQKAGVGLIVSVEGTVSNLSATGIRDGTVWTLYWSESVPADFAQWQLIAEGTVRDSAITQDFANKKRWLLVDLVRRPSCLKRRNLQLDDCRSTIRAMTASRANEDRALVSAFLAGNESAFNEIMVAHEDRVFSLCLRIMRTREAALDAVQETFITVFRKAHLYNGESAFSTWLYRVATNTCYDQLRKQKRRRTEAMPEGREAVDPTARRRLLGDRAST